MQINKTDQKRRGGLAQIVRTGWYRSVHVKSFDSHRARALLGARTHHRHGPDCPITSGVCSRHSVFCRRDAGVAHLTEGEALLLDRSDVALIVGRCSLPGGKLREQIAVFDNIVY